MRALKVLLLGMLAAIGLAAAVAAGFVAAAVIGAIGLAVYVVRRLLGQSPGPRQPRSTPTVRQAQAGEAIEVTATEVPADPLDRRLNS